MVLGLVVLVAAGCKPPEVSITETPIKIASETEGHGSPVQHGDRVVVDYRITLPSGAELLSAHDYGFQVGQGAVIRGIDEAIVGMRTGGTRQFICPPQRHWGRAGYADKVPPATDLEIWLRLNRIEGRSVRRVGTATE